MHSNLAKRSSGWVCVCECELEDWDLNWLLGLLLLLLLLDGTVAGEDKDCCVDGEPPCVTGSDGVEEEEEEEEVETESGAWQHTKGDYI